MRVWLVTFVLAASGFLFAQSASGASSSHSSIKTLTSADGAFRLTYSGVLTQCEKRPQGAGFVWVQRECSAYYPTCGASLDLAPEKEIVVCLAYPRNKHTDTDTFEAATFSVGIPKIVDRTECLSPKLSQIDSKKNSLNIGGVIFRSFETAAGGMNQGGSADVLRAFHDGRCYEMATSIVTANAGAFDPPPREMTKEDWEDVTGKLNQARDSFRFLQ